MMPDYMRRLWKSGLCPYLVPASFYTDRGYVKAMLHPEGLIRAQDYALLCPDGIEDSFCTLLIPVIATNTIKDPAFAEQLLQLDVCDFVGLGRSQLADPAFISLAPGGLYYDAEKERSLLLFSEQADPRPFSVRFCDLCDGLGGSGGLIAARLSDACGYRVTEEKGAAAFLRNWCAQILSAQ